jgi:hypothetical protein
MVNAATAYVNIMGAVVEDVITDDDGPDTINEYDRWI